MPDIKFPSDVHSEFFCLQLTFFYCRTIGSWCHSSLWLKYVCHLDSISMSGPLLIEWHIPVNKFIAITMVHVLLKTIIEYFFKVQTANNT